MKKVIFITDYRHLKASECGKTLFENKRILDLSENNPKSVVLTQDEVYLTSYCLQALENRGKEYSRLTSKWR